MGGGRVRGFPKSNVRKSNGPIKNIRFSFLPSAKRRPCYIISPHSILMYTTTGSSQGLHVSDRNSHMKILCVELKKEIEVKNQQVSNNSSIPTHQQGTILFLLTRSMKIKVLNCPETLRELSLYLRSSSTSLLVYLLSV